MSRNNDRQNFLDESLTDGFPEPQTNQANPHVQTAPTSGFNWISPTQFVELPTAGIFYPEGHPAHGKTKLEINYMTALQEDMLTSEDLLKEGVAVTRMIQSLLVDKNINIKDLLIADVNALMVASRVTGFGPEYTTGIRCSNCGSVDEHQADLNEALEITTQKTIERVKTLDRPLLAEDGTMFYEIELPLSRVVVGCKLLTGTDEEKVSKKSSIDSSSKSLITTLLRTIIYSVNGETNPIAVASFTNSMPTQDSQFLRKEYLTLIPNFSLKQQYACQSCGHTADVEVPLNADFFWP